MNEQKAAEAVPKEHEEQETKGVKAEEQPKVLSAHTLVVSTPTNRACSEFRVYSSLPTATRVCGEGTFGCSSALTPLVSCSSCSSGTASAAFCSFICGHVAYARVGAGQALRVVKLGCRAKARANWVLRLVRRGSNPGWKIG